MEKRSRGQVIWIECDNARDCSIMSGDEPRGPEMDLSIMDMTHIDLCKTLDYIQ